MYEFGLGLGLGLEGPGLGLGLEGPGLGLGPWPRPHPLSGKRVALRETVCDSMSLFGVIRVILR